MFIQRVRVIYKECKTIGIQYESQNKFFNVKIKNGTKFLYEYIAIPAFFLICICNNFLWNVAISSVITPNTHYYSYRLAFSPFGC